MGGSDGMMIDTPPTERKYLQVSSTDTEYDYNSIVMEHTNVHTESLIGIGSVRYLTTEPSSW